MYKFGESDTGLIFDECAGQAYNDVRLIDMARSWGFMIPWPELPDSTWFRMGQDAQEDYEYLSELSELALDYMNGMCQPGYVFEWDNGSLFLSALDNDYEGN